MKNWRPVIVLLAVAALAHYSFLLVRSMREWNLQRENQLLRQQLLSASSLLRDVAATRELARKLNVTLGPPPETRVGELARTDSTPAAAGSSWGAPLSMPVAGRKSRSFERAGWPRQLDHAGLDVAALPGEPVMAAAAGRVVFRDLTQRLGFLVLVDHGNGFVTGYGHLSMALPEIGEPVRRGEVLGRVAPGAVGQGSHLHFSAQRNGIPVDPAPLLRGWTDKENEDS